MQLTFPFINTVPIISATPPSSKSDKGMGQIVRVLFGVCAVISAYHLFSFWRLLGKPIIVSALFTVAFLLFNMVCLSMMRNTLMKAMAVLVIGFSMFATFYVGYTAMPTETIRADAEVESLLNEKNTAIALLIDGMEQDRGEANHWKAVSWEKYDTAINRVSAQQTALNQLLSEKSALEGQLFKQETAWTVVGDNLGVSEKLLRLLVLVFPAMFLDLLMPICFCWGMKK